ncbi:hypothetical protein ACHAW6_011632 [Cyclotella cf. meneghiniana]
MIVWLQTLLSLLRLHTASSSSHVNLYNQPLQPCSTAGMAQTGYTRDGTCVDRYDDSGSHHICIDLSSASSDGLNFCQVTGQSNWCAEQMPCDDDGTNYCPVKDWCVCQWAFASYLQEAGGCDAIQEIRCEATNMQTVEAYRSRAGEEKYENALACLTQRCGLSVAA